MTRVRFTTHLPMDGTRIGLIVWTGSMERGWVGRHVNPLKWNRTWRIIPDSARKAPCLYPLSDGRRCCECDTCQETRTLPKERP